jgi:hypothetical protein
MKNGTINARFNKIIKIAAGLCYSLGPLEFINFFLGYTSEGIIWLLISVFTCGILTSLLGLIEGIYI